MDLILLQPPKSNSLRRNLVAFWKLGEAGGTRYSSKSPGIGPAAQFTSANTESLSKTSNASLVTGNIDFTIACWVYLDSESGVMIPLSKLAAVSDVEYEFGYNNATDRFAMTYTNGDAVSVVANTFGAVSTGTWYLLIGWYDATADTLNITVNNGAVDSLADGGVKPPGNLTGLLGIGIRGADGTYPWNGRIKGVALWKKVLSAAERTTLYNNGNGLAYRDVSGSLLTSLISWWDLSEFAGTRYDSVTTNHLTDNNTVTQATGVAGGNSLGTSNNPGNAAGKIGNAANFVYASSQGLIMPDNADMSMGAGVRMNVSCWIYLNSNNYDIYDIILKSVGPSNYEWGLAYRGSTGSPANVLEFFVTSDGTLGTYAFVQGTTFGQLSINTWYFIEAGYDGTNLYISVNNGVRDTTAFSADIFNGTSGVGIGDRDNSAGRFMDGRIDAVGLWKRSLTAFEVAKLYKGGAGREYPF